MTAQAASIKLGAWQQRGPPGLMPGGQDSSTTAKNKIALACCMLERRGATSAKQEETMAEEAFSLKDAIALYSGKIDLSHKLWAYLQVVALAVMGFAWSAERSALVLWALLVVFVVFAALNGLLLVGTQSEAVEIEAAIKKYREKYEKKEINSEL